jgi:hypothetical protein
MEIIKNSWPAKFWLFGFWGFGWSTDIRYLFMSKSACKNRSFLLALFNFEEMIRLYNEI